MKNSISIRKQKLVYFLAIFSIAFLVCSCSDDDDNMSTLNTTKSPYKCETCAKNSEALAIYDESAKGIYKGVFPSGSLVVNAYNSSDEISAKIYYASRVIEMVPDREILMYQSGTLVQSFRGFLNDQPATFTFTVEDGGNSPIVANLYLPGAKTAVECMIYKEKSTDLFEDFEGKYFKKSKIYNQDGGIDSGVGKPDNYSSGDDVTDIGTLRLIMSRRNMVWTLYKTMNGNVSVMDRGDVVGEDLISSSSGDNIARISSDELNHQETNTTSPVFLYATRRR